MIHEYEKYLLRQGRIYSTLDPQPMNCRIIFPLKHLIGCLLWILFSSVTFTACLFTAGTSFLLPEAIQGVLDLSKVDFQKIETLPISGELEFYWNSLTLQGDPVYLRGPRGWKIQFPAGFPFDYGYGGYGTYRVIVLLPPELKEVGIYIPPQHSAYVLSINGEEVGWNGTVGTDPITHRGEWKPLIAQVKVEKPILEIILQVSDFTMDTGGYFYPLRIGLPQTVLMRHRTRSFAETATFGILFFTGIYCLSMFFLHRREKGLLYLGIASVLFAIRTVTHGEMVYSLFFSVNVETVNKVRYLTLYLIPLVVWGFFVQFLQLKKVPSSPKGLPMFQWVKMVGIVAGILCAGFIGVTLGTPSRVFVPTLSYFPFYAGVLSVLILYGLIEEIRKKNFQGWILLIGFILLLVTIIHDLYIASNRLWDNSFYSPFGYVGFILSLSIVLGNRFSKLLEEQRVLVAEREAQTQFLETLVQERTQELQKVNDSLAQAVKTANDANQAKSTFLAMMSHEIRTSMNVVAGITELLEQSPLNRVQTEYIQTLRSAAEGLLAILNDVLDLSRIESGHIQLEQVETDLGALVEEIEILFKSMLVKKGLYLTCTIKERCPRTIVTDPTRLRQILSNLISNAIKFTSCGGIRLTVSCESSFKENEEIQLRFEVEDTGIGIPADKIETIFQSFVQADGSINRRFGGTGLGLTISKRFVEMLGGSIQVKSIEGKGSTFVFTIRAKVVEVPDTLFDRETPIENPVNLEHKLRILLVEDNAMNRLVGEALLKSLGLQSKAVSSGKEAIFCLQNDPWDLVLMDIEMPEMNGIETTQRIRNGEAGTLNQQVPIIALTAHVLPDVYTQALEGGMDGYITKPISRENLLKAIQIGVQKRGIEQKERAFQQDIVSLIRKYNGNEMFVLDLCRNFTTDVTAFLPKMEEDLASNNFEGLQQKSRSLRNLALLLERGELARSLDTLQRSCAGRDFAECTRILQAVIPELLFIREQISLLLTEKQDSLIPIEE